MIYGFIQTFIHPPPTHTHTNTHFISKWMNDITGKGWYGFTQTFTQCLVSTHYIQQLFFHIFYQLISKHWLHNNCIRLYWALMEANIYIHGLLLFPNVHNNDCIAMNVSEIFQCWKTSHFWAKQLFICIQILVLHFTRVSHWTHDVVAMLNQRHWRWFNVATTSCVQWEAYNKSISGTYYRIFQNIDIFRNEQYPASMRPLPNVVLMLGQH